MTWTDPPGAAGTPWHIFPALLVAYANGQAGPADAWSAEAHLVSCSMCRAELALVLREPQSAAIGEVRGALLAGLPAQIPHRRKLSVPPMWRLVLRPAAVLAVVVALAAALVLNALSARGIPLDVTGDGLFWLLAPILPLGGVALCSVGELDPWREAVLAAPSAGLRLILWRTAVVMAVAVPSAAVAGLVLGSGSVGPALWLLPCLALTTAALALGTQIGLERAAAVVAFLWCAGTLGPALARSGGSFTVALQQHVQQSSYPTATVFSAPAQGWWALLALAAVGVLVLRRDSYEQLPRAVGKRTT